MKENVLFIEFTGLPGAGKTTVAYQAVQFLMAKEYSVYTSAMLFDYRARMTRCERGFSLIKFIFRHFHLVLNIFYFGFLFKPFNFFSLKYSYGCVRTIFKIKTAIKIAMQAGYDVVIFDQGILQDLWSIGVTGTPTNICKFEDHLFKLLECVKGVLNYSAVQFKVHIENAAERILTRDPSKYRFDNMDRKSILDTLKKKSSYLRLIVDTASRVNQCKQLVIETNSASIETSVHIVATFISNELLAVSSSPSKWQAHEDWSRE